MQNISLSVIESDPAFKGLSYQDQIKVRAAWLNNTLGNDPTFQKLDPVLKRVTVDNILYRPPVMENPQNQVRATTIGQGFQKKDPTAVKYMLGQTVARAAWNQFSLARALGYTVGSIGKTIGIPGSDAYVSSLFSKDSQKEIDYYNYLLESDSKLRNTNAILSGMAGLAAGMVDTAAQYSVLAGTTTAPKLLAKLAQEAVTSRAASFAIKMAAESGKGVRLANWAAREAIPSVIHAVAGGGLVGATRETTLALLDSNKDNPSFGEIMTNMAKGFGSYALGDLMFFAALAPVKSLMKGVKNTFVGGKSTAMMTNVNVTSQNWFGLLKIASTGQALPEELIAQLPEEAVKPIRRLHDYAITLKQLPDLQPTDFGYKKIHAGQKGWELEQLDNGMYKVTSMVDPNVLYHFDDRTLGTFLGTIALDPLMPLGPETTKSRFQIATAYAKSVKRAPSVDVYAVEAKAYWNERRNPVQVPKELTPAQRAAYNFIIGEKATPKRPAIRPSAYVPASMSVLGPGGIADDYLMARAFYERAALDVTQVSKLEGVTIDDFLPAIRSLKDQGFMSYSGTPINSFGAGVAYHVNPAGWRPEFEWWNWAPDAPSLGAYRGYLSGSIAANIWDDAYKSMAPTPSSEFPKVGRVGPDVETLTQTRRRIPISQRWAVTTQEAEQLTRQGLTVKGAVAMDPGDMRRIKEGRQPQFYSTNTTIHFIPNGGGGAEIHEAVVMSPKNIMPAKEWELLPGHSEPKNMEIAMIRGFDAAIDKYGNYIIFDPQYIKLVRASVENMAPISRVSRLVTDPVEASTIGAISNFYKVKQIIVGQLAGNPKTTTTMIAQLLAPGKDGMINRQNLNAAAKLWMRANGLDPATHQFEFIASDIAKMIDAGEVAQVRTKSNFPKQGEYQHVVSLPIGSKIVTAEAEEAYIKAFAHEMDHAVQVSKGLSGAGALNKVNKPYFPKNVPMTGKEPTMGWGKYTQTIEEIRAESKAIDFVKKYRKYSGYTYSWAQHAAAKQGWAWTKTQDGYSSTVPELAGKSVSFDQIVETILKKDLNVAAIHENLREAGIVLQEGVTEDGTKLYRLMPYGAKVMPQAPEGQGRVGKQPSFRTNVIDEDTDLLALLNRNGWHPKASSFLGPELMFIDPKGGEVRYYNHISGGSYQNQLRHANSFLSKETKMKRQSKKLLDVGESGRLMFDSAKFQYEVEIPNVAYRKTFGTVKEALEFMRGGWRKFENLTDVAMHKGFRIQLADGGWHLWNDEGHYFEKTWAGFEERLRTAPIPAWSPELLDPNYRGWEIKQKPTEGTFKPDFLQPWEQKGEGIAPLLNISQWYRPADAYFLRAVEKGANPEALGLFRELQLGKRAANAEQFAIDRTIFTMFKAEGSKNKLMPKDRRIAVFEYLDANTEDAKLNVKNTRKLTDYELQVATSAKTLLDDLFIKFGVPLEMKLDQYISHLRTNVTDFRKLYAGTIAETLRKTGAPDKIKAFFEFWRESDFAEFVHDSDALSVLLKYSSMGHRVMHLNPTLSKLKKFINTSVRDGGLDTVVAKRLRDYADASMGLHTPNEEALMRFVKQLGEKIAPKYADSMKNFYQLTYSLGYVSLMGWRPFSAIRNLLQVFTTLAPRFGNSNMMRGMEYALKNPEHLFNTLKMKGLIAEAIPVFGSELLDVSTAFSKITRTALKWYKNSDDVTRATAYGTAKVQWEDAYKLYTQAVKDGAGAQKATNIFMEASGLNLVAPDIRAKAYGFIQKGQWEPAFDTFVDDVMATTMFQYQAALNPTAFRGLIGKMFGMFGVYPAWFVESVKRGLKYGGPAQKLAFATRFLGNSLAIYGGLAAIGIRAKDFLPWVPMQFSGGPFYKLANNLLTATGSDYAARQARGELKKQVPRTLVPGLMTTQSFLKAIDLFDQGNAWEGFAAIGGIPLFPQN